MPDLTKEEFLAGLTAPPAEPMTKDQFLAGLQGAPSEIPAQRAGSTVDAVQNAAVGGAIENSPTTLSFQGIQGALKQVSTLNVLPRNQAEALDNWGKNGLTVHHTPQRLRELAELREGIALYSLRSLGLMDEDNNIAAEVTNDYYDKLRGAIDHVVVPMFSSLTTEEGRTLAGHGMRSLMGHVKQGYETRLREFQDADGRPVIPPEGSEGRVRLETYRSQYALAHELESRAGEPEVQSLYVYHVKRALERKAHMEPAGSDGAVQLGLETSLLSDESRKKWFNDDARVKVGAIPAGKGGVPARLMNSPLANKVEEVFRGGLTQLENDFGPEDALANSFRGELQRMRLERMGFRGDALTGGIGTAAVLANKEFATETLNAVRSAQVRKEAGLSLSVRSSKEFSPEWAEKLERATPAAMVTLIDAGVSPIEELARTEVAPGARNFVQGLSSLGSQIGEVFRHGLNAAGPLTKLLTDSLGDPERHALAGHVASLGIGEGMRHAYEEYNKAYDAAQAEDPLDAPRPHYIEPSMVPPAGFLMPPRGPSSGPDQRKLWAMRETVFNPNSTIFGQMAMLAAAPLADATMQELGRLGIGPRLLANEMKSKIHKVWDETHKEGDEALAEAHAEAGQQLTNIWQNARDAFNPLKVAELPGLRIIPALANWVVAGAKATGLQVLKETKDTLQLFVEDPKTAGEISVLTLGLGGGAAASVPLRRRLARTARGRMRVAAAADSLKRAVLEDPATSEKVRDFLKSVAPLAKGERFDEALDIATANLDTIVENNRRTVAEVETGTDRGRIETLRPAAREFERQLKRFGEDDLYDILSAAGADRFDLEEIKSLNLSSLGGIALQKFKTRNKTGTNFVGRKMEGLAEKLNEAIEAGQKIPKLEEDLPISLDAAALRDIQPGLRGIATRAYEKLPDSLKESTLGSVLAKFVAAGDQRGDLVKQAVQFDTNGRITISAVRAMNAESVSNIEDFIKTRANLLTHRAQQNQMQIVHTPDPKELRALTRGIISDRRQTAALRAQAHDVGRTFWDKPIRLKDVNWFKDVEFEEIYGWARRTQREGDIDDIFSGILEEDSIGDILTRKDVDDPKVQRRLERKARKMKNDLADRFLYSTGLQDEVDLLHGDIVHPAVGDRLRARAKEMDVDPELLGLVSRPSGKDLLEKIRTTAELQKAFRGHPDERLLRRQMVRADDLGAPLSQIRQEMRDFQMEMMVGMFTNQVRKNQLDNLLVKLSPEQRALFETVLVQRKRQAVKAGDIETLRREVPEADLWLARTEDELVNAALDHSEGLRKRLLLMNHEAGGGRVQDRPYLESHLGPYLPHRYEAYEIAKSLESLDRPSLQFAITSGGLDPSWLNPQREIGRFKAVVYRRGEGGPIQRQFATRKAAKKWIDERHGGAKLEQGGAVEGLVGKTGFGDHAAILDPLDPQTAEDLGLMGAVEGMSARLGEFPKNIAMKRIHTVANRPGWSVSEDDWAALPARERGEYSALIDGKVWGALQGKRLHKSAVGFITEATDFIPSLEAYSKAAQELAQSQNLWTRLVTGRVGGLGSWYKRRFIQNKIMRSGKTVANNYISDRLIFSQLAVGPGINFTRAGWRETATSAKDVWSYVMRGEVPDTPEFHEMVRLGIWDDFESISSPDTNVAAAANKVLYGGDELLYDKTRAFWQGMKDWDGPVMAGAMRRIFGLDVEDNPRVRRLMDKRDRFQGVLDRNRGPDGKMRDDSALSADQWAQVEEARARVDAQLKTVLEPRGGQMGRAISGAMGWLAGAKKGVLKDHALFSTKFYGFVNNANRAAAYYYARRHLGWSPEYAGEQIRRFMQTYSQVPRAVKEFSRLPFANPVASFSYEAARIAGNVLLHKPAAALAYTAFMPAMNLVQGARAGVDVHTTMAGLQRSTGMPSWLMLTSGLITPGEEAGEFGFTALPALSPTMFYAHMADGQFERFFNLQQRRAAGENVGLASFAIGATLGNPLSQAGLALFSNSDPKTGRPVESSLQGVYRGGIHALQGMIPPETPFVGSNHALAVDNRDNISYGSLARNRTLDQKQIGIWFGLQHYGKVGNTGPIAKLARFLSVASGGGYDTFGLRHVDKPIEVVRDINWEDAAMATLRAAKQLEPSHISFQNVGLHRDRELYRLAARSEGLGDMKTAEALRAQAREAMVGRINALRKYQGAKSAPGPALNQEETKLRDAAKSYFDFDDELRLASPWAAAHMIAAMATSEVTPADAMRRLVWVATSSDSGEPATPTNINSITTAQQVIEETLASGVVPEKHEKALLIYNDILREQAGRATLQFGGELLRKMQAEAAAEFLQK